MWAQHATHFIDSVRVSSFWNLAISTPSWNYVCGACAIMPDIVVVAWSDDIPAIDHMGFNVFGVSGPISEQVQYHEFSGVGEVLVDISFHYSDSDISLESVSGARVL